MCLEMLKQGQAEMAHLQAVLGFFNIGMALAFLANEDEVRVHIERAQTVVAKANVQQDGHYALSGDELVDVVAVFNFIDDYLRQQFQHKVQRAFDYLDRALSGQEQSADVMSLRALMDLHSAQVP